MLSAAASRKSIRRSPRSRKSRCCSARWRKRICPRQLRPDLEKRLLAKRIRGTVLGRQRLGLVLTRSAATRPADFKNLKIFVTATNSATELQLCRRRLQARRARLGRRADRDADRRVDAVPTVPILALSGQYYTIAKHMTALNWAPLVGATVITKQGLGWGPPAMRPAPRRPPTRAGDSGASRRENEKAVETMKTKLHATVHAASPRSRRNGAGGESRYPKIRGPIVPADTFDQVKRLATRPDRPTRARNDRGGGLRTARPIGRCPCIAAKTAASLALSPWRSAALRPPPARASHRDRRPSALVQHLALAVGMLGGAIAAREGRLLALSTPETQTSPGALSPRRAVHGRRGWHDRGLPRRSPACSSF